jgi:hypothetical protein
MVARHPAALPAMRDAAVTAALAAWSVVATLSWLGLITIPQPGAVVRLLPLVALAVLAGRRERIPRHQQIAALVGLGVGVALLAAPVATATPRKTAGFAVALAAGALSLRWRVGMVALAFLLSGAHSSVQAFLHLDPYQAVDLLLGGFYAGVVLTYLLGRRRTAVTVSPSVLAVAAFIVVALVSYEASDQPWMAGYAFHVLEFYMLAFVAMTLCPWTERQRVRLLRAIIGMTTLVAAYAVWRWIIGPAAAEKALVLADHAEYNFTDNTLNAFGSFSNTRSLGVWMSTLCPFALSCAMGLGGRTRLVAAAATGLCFTALLGSHLRAGIPAILLGGAIVVLLHLGSRAWSARRLGAAALAILVLAGGMVAVGYRSPGTRTSEKSYAALLRPNHDPSYDARKDKWHAAMKTVRSHPWGQGLGTSGQAYLRFGALITVSSYDIDSSYLNIALDFGYPGFALFAAAMLLLLRDLGRRGLRDLDRRDATIAIGAAAALASFLVVCYSGNYIEGLPALPAWLLAGFGLAKAAPARPARP